MGVHYRENRAGAEATAREITASGGTSVLLGFDLLDPAQCDHLVEEFLGATGGIDVLVNNAGGVRDYVDFRALSVPSFEHAMSLNVRAPLWLARGFWPCMVAAGGGRIINITSAAVRYGGSASGIHYVAAKASLEGITLALAKEGAGSRILVNAVRPGVVDTGMHERIIGYSDEQWQRRKAQIPLGRAARSGEIAAVVAFLASEASSYVTGQIITVAGGD